ncbi:Alpha amylase, catalytic domain containing protein [Tritrichomonas foetus]|uniref:Alpha-amylase n=1 Tax=Tritrichomonas foetus TaxID=1144522 RepID=A0A1J4JMZ4_9EUKA|nr:Alpha amylase, catalytic domain containing protein [Tritrichomonas foetus]|eukprot:OHS98907.1 Alpha amylase, catalytic domain containing protein [Tritrichomonas foetus]
MSREHMDEEPLINNTQNDTPKSPKKMNCLFMTIGITAAAVGVALIIGLSVGLTNRKKKESPNSVPIVPSNTPYPTRTAFPTPPSQYPSATSYIPTPEATPLATSSNQPSTQPTSQPTSVPTYQPLPSATPDVLPNCEIYPSMECNGNSGDMDSQYQNHTWHTPTRGSADWHIGFQDMSVLVGYAQLKYKSGRKGCTVNVVTKTRDPNMQLNYYFDGVVQSSNSKDFDSTYVGILNVKVVATTGESLELEDIDFVWNSEPLLERSGDYRNGQKGGIVEMFGWPDEDVAKECKHIAESGYLGVKLFPHQEQLMSGQPDQNALNPWYWMYQPVSYSLNGRMGSRDTLRRMIKICRSYGLRVYADAVVNHMAAGGNDILDHRNPSSGCTTWGGKYSSKNESYSPFFTPAWTYKKNERGEPDNVLEFPAVPYGPMDFHCNKGVTSWSDANILNTGWLVGLSDLDTSKEYVRQRICDYFVDLISIGFSGFRVDAAKHIHPDDLAVIFAKFKESMGGSLPEDWITWLEVLTGGEAYLLVQSGSDYSFTTYLTEKMQAQGMSDDDILKVKIWWCGYLSEPDNDYGSLDKRRKAVQNDDHDQQNPGSSSRDMHGEGCVLVKGCDADTHRGFEVKLFSSPNSVDDNDNNYPIRFVLSSYYFQDDCMSIPDGLSDCSLCTKDCNSCKSRSFTPAYVENAQAYSGSGYTYVHRDQQIINAMRSWMHL